MLKKSIHVSFLLLVEVLAGLLAVVAFGVFLLAWRLSSGPLEADFLSPYLADILSVPESGLAASVGTTDLYWYGEGAEIEIQVNQVNLVDAAGRNWLSAPLFHLNFDLLGWVMGKPPLVGTMSDPTLTLLRTPEGNYTLGAPRSLPQPKREKAAQVQEAILSWLRLGEISAPLIHTLRIDDGRLRILDVDGSLRVEIDMPLFSMTRLENALSGSVGFHVRQPDGQATISLNYGYALDSKLLTLGLRFADITPASLASKEALLSGLEMANLPLSGNIQLVINPRGEVQSAAVRIEGGAGTLALRSVIGRDYPVEALRLELEQTGPSAPLTLKTADILLGNAARIELTGQRLRDKAQWQTQLHAKIRNVALADVPDLWPEEVGPNPRRWVLANMQKGRVYEAAARAILTAPHDDPLALDLTDLSGTLDMRDTDVRYYAPLPVLKNASATAAYTLEKMEIAIRGGEAGGLILKPSTAVIYGFDQPVESIDIVANVEGELSKLLPILNREPFKYLDKMGLPADVLSGQAAVTLNLTLPLLRDVPLSDVKLAATSRLRNVRVDERWLGAALMSQEIALTVNESGLKLTGPIGYAGRTLALEWSEDFTGMASYRSRARLKGSLPAKLLTDLGWERTWGIMDGRMALDARYEQPRDASARVTADLDLTPLAMDLGRLNWKKNAGVAGNGRLELRKAGDVWRIHSARLSAPELEISGATDRKTGHLMFDALNVGATRAQLEYIPASNSSSGATTILNAQTLDLSGAAPEAIKPSARKPYILNLTAETLILQPGKALQNVTLEAQQSEKGWQKLIFSASAAPNIPVQFALRPRTDAPGFTLEGKCPDLGALLAAATSFDNLRGGNLVISGHSDPARVEEGIYGQVSLTNYSVRRLPALAALVSVVSPTGLLELASGQGMQFDKLSGKFLWSPEQEKVHLNELRTRGSSIGLSVEGPVDLAAETIDLKGTIVPASFFNRMIAFIPVIGDLLTGGGDGIFAATYKATGTLDDPRVSVNPIAALAPGFMRKLFFMGDSDDVTSARKPEATTPSKIQNFNQSTR